MNVSLPEYTPAHYKKLIASIDPIGEYGGFSIKQGDKFHLGPIVGSKVRQCLHVVYTNWEHIQQKCNGGILTASGLPSPQTMIVAAVAKYFGLKCAVIVPKFENNKRDFNRISVSVAQKFGAVVYGVGNPNPAGPEHDAKELVKQLGYYQIKFGMLGDVAMQPVINQFQNIPKYVKDIVIISGSGLSALSVLLGTATIDNNVETLHVVCLSNHIIKNKEAWFDSNPLAQKVKTKLHLIPSDINYRTEYKWNNSLDFDLIYESKAFKWMSENFKPSKKTLFWIVGRKLYDLDLIEPINWHMSNHEQGLREEPSDFMDQFFI
jgi:1-aminocyclopropane-1-carboxylate deaminase/D-cysteine desulfhydrase-like pyridoxal-dependent ACC family enzyme